TDTERTNDPSGPWVDDVVVAIQDDNGHHVADILPFAVVVPHTQELDLDVSANVSLEPSRHHVREIVAVNAGAPGLHRQRRRTSSSRSSLHLAGILEPRIPSRTRFGISCPGSGAGDG